MSEVDQATRERFFGRLKEHWARVFEEAIWVTYLYGSEIPAARARDLVNEAVTRVLEGRRAWPEDVGFVSYMRGVMDSIVWGEWKKVRLHQPIGGEVENEDGRAPRQLAAVETPREELIEQAEAEARVYEILEAAQGDERLEKIVEAYLADGCDRPRHVAKRLGITDKDVYVAQKKLERRVLSARKKVTK